jgi:hypothetical protein
MPLVCSLPQLTGEGGTDRGFYLSVLYLATANLFVTIAPVAAFTVHK